MISTDSPARSASPTVLFVCRLSELPDHKSHFLYAFTPQDRITLASELAQVKDRLSHGRFDLCVIDEDVLKDDPVSFVMQVIQACGQVPVVVAGPYMVPRDMAQLRDAGARGFFQKTAAHVPTRARILQHVIDGGTFFPKIDVPAPVVEQPAQDSRGGAWANVAGAMTSVLKRVGHRPKMDQETISIKEAFALGYAWARTTPQTLTAAVVAMPRSGSKFACDYLGMALSPLPSLFHTHGVSDVRLKKITKPRKQDASLKHFDGLPPQEWKYRQFMKHRKALTTAKHRLVIMTDRHPLQRISSAFANQKARWLRPRLADDGSFNDLHEVMDEYHRFAKKQAAHLQQWYEAEIEQGLGFSLGSCALTDDQPATALHKGSDILVIVRTASLSHVLNDQVLPHDQVDHLPLIGRNSSADRNELEVARAVKALPLDDAVVELYEKIPQVRAIHGPKLRTS